MFFRGKRHDVSIWRRFRTAADGFSFLQEEEDLFVAHIVANAERIVDLFDALMEHLPPAVEVHLKDARTGRAWRGEHVALPDVRTAFARLRAPVAQLGGVELAVYTEDDQLTVNPVLELFIYARTDQWLYILQGMGLEQHQRVRTKSWKLGRTAHPPAPELSEAVAEAAESLGLSPA